MERYDLDNFGEEPIEILDLQEIAKNHYNRNWRSSGSPYYVFQTRKGNVYIITTMGDVYLQKLLNRNEAEFKYFGVFRGDEKEFEKSMKLVEDVQSGHYDY